jgi:hypothetical protein
VIKLSDLTSRHGEQLHWFHLTEMALVGAGIFLVVSYRGRDQPT